MISFFFVFDIILKMPVAFHSILYFVSYFSGLLIPYIRYMYKRTKYWSPLNSWNRICRMGMREKIKKKNKQQASVSQMWAEVVNFENWSVFFLLLILISLNKLCDAVCSCVYSIVFFFFVMLKQNAFRQIDITHIWMNFQSKTSRHVSRLMLRTGSETRRITSMYQLKYKTEKVKNIPKKRAIVQCDNGGLCACLIISCHLNGNAEAYKEKKNTNK